MRAGVWTGGSALETIDDWPSPDPRDDEIVIDVHYCGFCGSDAHILSGRYASGSPPRVLGHEVSGVVAKVGAAASGFRVGDRVACNLYASCGFCRQCRLGRPNHCPNRSLGNAGFAEQAVYRAEQLFRLPDEISLRHGALLEPVATVLHALEQGRVAAGDAVLVLGAGALGALAVRLARLLGAGRIAVSEPNSRRRQALTGHADVLIDPSAGGLSPASAETGLQTVDLVLDLAGVATAVEEAIDLLAPGGRLVIAGVYPPDGRLSLRPTDFFERELSVVGSFASRHTAERALGLLPALDLDSVITHELDLATINLAYALHTSGESIKTLVSPR